MDDPPIRIVIVDDHTLLREGTRHLLAAYPDLAVVAEASRGDDVPQLVSDLRPDVVLLDVQLPGMNGIEVTRIIASSASATRVLILTAHADEDYVHAALAAGASGYLLKTTRASDLADAIRAVHAGKTTVVDSSLVLTFLRHAGDRGNDGDDLTRREHDVLRLVAAGLSNRAIAQDLGISHRTVEGHLHRIFEKEDVGSRVELLRYALEHRLLTIPPK